MSHLGPSKSNERVIPWISIFEASGPLLPFLITSIIPAWTFLPFTPRQLIYSNDTLTFLLAPWAAPTSPPAFMSRVAQTYILWRLPDSAMLYCYPLWIVIALLRTILGYVLSRSVGWAHPSLFSHWALYEMCGGFGPSLVAYFYFIGATELLKALPKKFKNYKVGELFVSIVLCALFCWLDNAPWTYGVAALAGTGCTICQRLFGLLMLVDRKFTHPLMLDGHKTRLPIKPRMLIGAMILSWFINSLPYGLLGWTSTPVLTNMPLSPSPPSPLLEILILSYPRPNTTVGATIMTTTINSYLPYLNEDVTLSVFTHSTSHIAFTNVYDNFKSTGVTFFVDTDSHPDAVSGQYLHLAEAFRWTLEKTPQAEWIMLVEDDFPLCGGEKESNAFKKVMELLAGDRVHGIKQSKWLGGFIGTGGSGLIIHRTLLSILILLMNAHSEISSKLPPNATRRPADLIIQDCLLGVDPLCPQRREGGGLIITSRLIMDHIGGMATTNKNKTYNNDKWRCGWRHPFHGRSEVTVVVV